MTPFTVREILILYIYVDAFPSRKTSVFPRLRPQQRLYTQHQRQPHSQSRRRREVSIIFFYYAYTRISDFSCYYSILIYEASSNGPCTKNSALATVFARCVRLAQLPLTPVFVFDGPYRPKVKQHKSVVGDHHGLVPDMQELFTAFGFCWVQVRRLLLLTICLFEFTSHQAPGEAEAQLAWLSKFGYIDLTITEDSDVLVFGARNVFRR